MEDSYISYKEILKGVLEDNNSHYYKNPCLKLSLISNEIDDEKVKWFIENYIQQSGKNKSELYNNIQNLDDTRALHILSTYVLGIYLYNTNKTIKEYIEEEVNKLTEKVPKKCKITFPYIWFLICLFHDLGYKYEKQSPPYTDFNKFLENKIYKKLTYLKSGLPEIYTKIHEKYFNYRISYQRKNDHGICAGYVLFNDMCAIRQKKEKEEEEKKGEKKGEKTDLYWGKPLEKIYKYASGIIIAHNIWYVKETDKDYAPKYKNHKMESLILKDNEYKIRIDEHPFLFLFCLVDTIEPCKKVKDVSLLENIMLKVNADKITIKSNIPCGCHATIIKQTERLNDWLTKTNTIKDEVEVEIYL